MPGFSQLREKVTVIVNELVADKEAGKRINNNPNEGTFLDLLLTPQPNMNHEVLGPSVLVDEDCAFITGGSDDTTGFTMENATYLFLKHPSSLQKLCQELDEARPHMKDAFDLQHILQLPFLTDVIKETLRLYTPAASPLPRTVLGKGVEVYSHFLPGGVKSSDLDVCIFMVNLLTKPDLAQTILTHSLYLIHHNHTLFADPKSFKPERRLGLQGKDLEQYYVPFSKGSRSCIGMALAYHELYTYLSVLFSRFDMEIFETVDHDMDWRDQFFMKRKALLKIRIVRDRWSGEVF